FPRADDADLARLVTDRFVRLSRWSGAAAGVAGVAGAVVDFGVLAWTQSRMVLHLAAVYGDDPGDRERAAELLVLTGVHRYASTARQALEVAARKAPVGSLVQPSDRSWGQLVWALATMVGMRAVKRAVAKVVPFVAVPLGALANGGATKKLAGKATALYADRQRERSGHRPLPSADPLRKA
ncbi:MAG: EcsC family protein, partial [Pseudonocardia sp.]|nr:EcsC family protein [Pseudonocardia sp.]